MNSLVATLSYSQPYLISACRFLHFELDLLSVLCGLLEPVEMKEQPTGMITLALSLHHVAIR